MRDCFSFMDQKSFLEYWERGLLEKNKNGIR